MDGNGNGQHIVDHDRIAAAARLKDDQLPKTTALRASILAGTSDEHPLVQGAAFYRHRPVAVS